MTKDTITIDLPRYFWEDHESRGLPSGRLVKTLARRVRVELDEAAAAEIRSDADHYATDVDLRSSLPGLAASARATVAAIDKAQEETT